MLCPRTAAGAAAAHISPEAVPRGADEVPVALTLQPGLCRGAFPAQPHMAKGAPKREWSGGWEDRPHPTPGAAWCACSGPQLLAPGATALQAAARGHREWGYGLVFHSGHLGVPLRGPLGTGAAASAKALEKWPGSQVQAGMEDGAQRAGLGLVGNESFFVFEGPQGRPQSGWDGGGLQGSNRPEEGVSEPAVNTQWCSFSLQGS